jgi:[ribosomal protein S18]-alanine N-acetyltransferase
LSKLETKVYLRRLVVADADQVFHLDQLSFSRPWSHEAYLEELGENELARYIGFFCEEQLIAFAGYWLIADEGHIVNVAVHPDWRREGWGELLMRHLITLCLGEGGRRMTLEVRRHNEAGCLLYSKLGFKIDGIRPNYYEDPPDDALIMWLELIPEPEACVRAGRTKLML